EYRGVWAPRNSRENGGSALWGRRGADDERPALPSDQRGERQRNGLGGAESGVHAAGHAAACAGGRAAPGGGEARLADAEPGYQRGRQQRAGWKVPGGLRVHGRCEYAWAIAANGIYV